jgi:hypothetical protein
VQSSRRLLALPVVTVLMAAPVLSGCGEAGEESAAVAVAKSGVLGGIGEQLKREDDEAEVEELHKAEPATPEERAEAREAAESRTMEAEDPESAIRPAELVGESS